MQVSLWSDVENVRCYLIESLFKERFDSGTESFDSNMKGSLAQQNPLSMQLFFMQSGEPKHRLYGSVSGFSLILQCTTIGGCFQQTSSDRQSAHRLPSMACRVKVNEWLVKTVKHQLR